MPRYTAQRQSLDNVGGAAGSRPMVDVGGAIQELANTATGLIHQQYLREQSRHERARQDRMEAKADSRYEQERGDRLSKEERDYSLKKSEMEGNLMAKGVTPGKEGGATVDIEEPAPAAPPPSALEETGKSAIQRAMTPQGLSVAKPAPQSGLAKPVARGSLGSIPKVTVGEEAPTPATYDPTKALSYNTAMDRAEMQQQTTLARSRMMGDFAVQAAKIRAGATVQSANVRAGATVKASENRAKGATTTSGGNTSNSSIVNAMKPTDRERHFKEVTAPGILRMYGGDLAAAVDDLEHTPGGADLKSQGFTAEYLAAVAGKTTNADQSAAIRLQAGTTALGTDSSVARVQQTRGAFSGPPLRGPKAAPKPGPIAAAVGGGKPKAKDASAAYQRAAAMYEQAKKTPGISAAEAKQAYDAEIALIAKRAGHDQYRNR